MLLDPFYGNFSVGRAVSRVLNRILIATELLVVAGLGYDIFHGGYISLWWLLAFVPGSLAAIAIANILIRTLNNFAMIIWYGTSDAEEIVYKHDRRMQRREQRRQARNEARQQRRLLREQKRRPPMTESDRPSPITDYNEFNRLCYQQFMMILYPEKVGQEGFPPEPKKYPILELKRNR